jgi:hypothetical protein
MFDALCGFLSSLSPIAPLLTRILHRIRTGAVLSFDISAAAEVASRASTPESRRRSAGRQPATLPAISANAVPAALNQKYQHGNKQYACDDPYKRCIIHFDSPFILTT